MKGLGSFCNLFLLTSLGLGLHAEAQLQASSPTFIKLLKDKLIGLSCFSENGSTSGNANIHVESTVHNNKAKILGYDKFSKMLSYEEIDGLSQTERNTVWEEMIAFQWDQMDIEKNCADDELNLCGIHGMIVCHMDDSNLSGLKRKNEIWELAKGLGYQISLSEFPIYNSLDGACYYGTMTVGAARAINEISDLVLIQPLSSVTKIRRGSISHEENSEEEKIDFEEEKNDAEEGQNDVEEGKNDAEEFPRLTRVLASLCPNTASSSDAAKLLGFRYLNSIKQDLKSEGNNKGSRSLLISESFYLTSSAFSLNGRGKRSPKEEQIPNEKSSDSTEHISSDKIQQGRNLSWKSILQDAVSPDLDCESALDEAAIEVEFTNSQKYFTLRFEFSAKNKASTVCYQAFIVGLATQKEICSVDKEHEAKIAGFVSQWVLQSGIMEESPWFDVGLTGAGQVVQVSPKVMR